MVKLRLRVGLDVSGEKKVLKKFAIFHVESFGLFAYVTLGDLNRNIKV